MICDIFEILLIYYRNSGVTALWFLCKYVIIILYKRKIVAVYTFGF